jgi:hypothetical protein
MSERRKGTIMVKKSKKDEQKPVEPEVPQAPRTPRPEEKFCPVKIGEQYIFRTVTFYQVGLVVDIIGNYVILANTIWVADMGRFDESLKDGTLKESVNVPTPGGWAAVNLNAVVDIYQWPHELPKS